MISYTIKHPLLYYDKVYKEKVGGIIRKEKPNSSKQVDNCSKLNFDSTVFLSLITDLDFLMTTCVVGGSKWQVIYLIALWRIYFINEIF